MSTPSADPALPRVGEPTMPGVTKQSHEEAPPEHRQSLGTRLAEAPTAFWVGVLLVVLLIGFNIRSNGVFLGTQSINNILLDAGVGFLLAVGMAFVLGAAQLDISIGGNLVLSSLLAAHVVVAIAGSRSGVGASAAAVWLGSAAGFVTAIVAGGLFGLVNGLIVTRLRVNSFIATLGTGGIALGAVLVISDGVNVNEFPVGLQSSFGAAAIFGLLPLSTLLALAVCGFLWFVMRRTRFGVRVIAIGSSSEAAVRSGISVDRIKLRLFVLMGCLAGLGGFLTIARFSTTNVGGGQTEALAAIAAAVIGGTSLFGGVVSIPGSLVGALLPVVLASGLIVVGVSTYYQLIVVGVILIIAVFVDQQRRRKRDS
jgi:ribose transport system permease protein